LVIGLVVGQWYVVGLVGKGDQDTQDAPIYSGFLEITHVSFTGEGVLELSANGRMNCFSGKKRPNRH
jgi:hypothetical protein